MIELISNGMLASVQDAGRYGFRHDGVGTAGAMDALALAAGNLMLGNEAGAAAIEMPMFPQVLQFHADLRFALTGADCRACLEGRPLPPWWTTRARRGERLVLGPAHHGQRLYLCVEGGIDVPQVLGSRSTQLRGTFGGFEGRTLRRGDRLAAVGGKQDWPTDFGVTPPQLALPLGAPGATHVRVLPASEYASYAAHARDGFWRQSWRITPQSDRYGYRLAGEALLPEMPLEMRSHGIVPGVIQVPPDGQPIIQMLDAQPSGGYPKFGTVIEADLWRLAQAPLGSRLVFQRVDYDQAADALRGNARWLAELESRLARMAGDGVAA